MTGCTVQRKISKGYKFRRFHCFPSKHKNHKNKQTASHMAINYAYNPQNQNFNKSMKFIANKIFALYSSGNIMVDGSGVGLTGSVQEEGHYSLILTYSLIIKTIKISQHCITIMLTYSLTTLSYNTLSVCYY